jgi:hypothetical protein
VTLFELEPQFNLSFLTGYNQTYSAITIGGR